MTVTANGPVGPRLTLHSFGAGRRDIVIVARSPFARHAIEGLAGVCPPELRCHVVSTGAAATAVPAVGVRAYHQVPLPDDRRWDLAPFVQVGLRPDAVLDLNTKLAGDAVGSDDERPAVLGAGDAVAATLQLPVFALGAPPRPHGGYAHGMRDVRRAARDRVDTLREKLAAPSVDGPFLDAAERAVHALSECAGRWGLAHADGAEVYRAAYEQTLSWRMFATAAVRRALGETDAELDRQFDADATAFVVAFGEQPADGDEHVRLLLAAVRALAKRVRSA